MSRNGDDGSGRAGHGSNWNQSKQSLIVKLKVPNLGNAGSSQYSTNSQDAYPFATFPVAPPANAPKRRGRPPKNVQRSEYAPPPKPKAADLPKPLATRSSKRKAAVMNEEPDEDDFESNQPPRKKSRSVSQAPPIRVSTRSRNRRASNSESGPTNTTGSFADEITNGHVTPTRDLDKDSSQSAPEILVSRNTSRAKEHLSSSHELMASIEPHDRLEEESGVPGVTTRAGARTRSTSTKFNPASQEDGIITAVIAAEEASDAANGDAEGVQSDSGILKPRGRGRWPNGAVKAKVMAAAVISKKLASKKKGAPGKRKTSDDAVVQAAYDRQAHLRSSYKDLRKIIIRAEQSLLDRALEELEDDPDRFKKTPYYDNVIKGLDTRLTKVLAQHERKDRLTRDMLERRFEANVHSTWKQHNVSLRQAMRDQITNSLKLEIKELQEKYEMICKRAIMDILKQSAREDDDTATVAEVCFICVFYL